MHNPSLCYQWTLRQIEQVASYNGWINNQILEQSKKTPEERKRQLKVDRLRQRILAEREQGEFLNIEELLLSQPKVNIKI